MAWSTRCWLARFVDYIPYYRQRTNTARSCVQRRARGWRQARAAGGEFDPLAEAHNALMRKSGVLNADETHVPMLNPGAGNTKRTYIWDYSRSDFDGLRGVDLDFRAKYPAAFVAGWNVTLKVCRL